MRALAVETNENWMEASRYINMDDLKEHKKLELRQAALPAKVASSPRAIAKMNQLRDATISIACAKSRLGQAFPKRACLNRARSDRHCSRTCRSQLYGLRDGTEPQLAADILVDIYRMATDQPVAGST